MSYTLKIDDISTKISEVEACMTVSQRMLNKPILTDQHKTTAAASIAEGRSILNTVRPLLQSLRRICDAQRQQADAACHIPLVGLRKLCKVLLRYIWTLSCRFNLYHCNFTKYRRTQDCFQWTEFNLSECFSSVRIVITDEAMLFSSKRSSTEFQSFHWFTMTPFRGIVAARD